jgi:hypothetical protein
MSDEYRNEGGGGLGIAILIFLAYVATIAFCIAFWAIPLYLGVRYVIRRTETKKYTYISRTIDRRAIWILPFILATIFLVSGSSSAPRAFYYPETWGRLIADLMFAYLPFVAFFGPVECFTGILIKEMRFWHFPFTRILVAMLCIGIGVSGVVRVDNDIRQAARADAYLMKHDISRHHVRYVPPKKKPEQVCLAAFWADRLMVQGPGVPARMTAGFLNELAWVSVFALDGTMLDLPEALMGGGTRRKAVHGAEIWGHYLDHRELLSFYLAFFGFGVGVWQLLMVYERKRLYGLVPIPFELVASELHLRKEKIKPEVHIPLLFTYKI